MYKFAIVKTILLKSRTIRGTVHVQGFHMDTQILRKTVWGNVVKKTTFENPKSKTWT